MSKSKMDRAYRIAEELVRDRLKKEDPGRLEDLESIEEADILVVKGVHDHIQQVFSVSGTRFALIGPGDIARADLRVDQVLFVNCGAKFSRRGIGRIRAFVEGGGFLFTTDWALRDVLESAFPGFVEYNERPTEDEVVRVVIHREDDPLLGTLIGPDDDPQWWLEGSSYPIRVLDDDAVDVIISSKEVGRKYGEPAVFVTFEVGEGRVYHMISHFYLQRTETRTARHRGSSLSYLDEKSVTGADRDKYLSLGASDASLAEVESAYTSSSMLSSVMLRKREQMRKRRRGEKRSAPPSEERSSSSPTHEDAE